MNPITQVEKADDSAGFDVDDWSTTNSIGDWAAYIAENAKQYFGVPFCEVNLGVANWALWPPGSTSLLHQTEEP